ncbi:MAG: methionyl-tRNA formyltransferase [Patescibacteria group bacterium]
MNILFFGTSKFAVPALEALTAAGSPPAAVITLPDRPHGRGLHNAPSPVALCAKKLELPLFQPEKLSHEESIKKLQSFHADIGIVVAYGKLIPENIIQLFPKGILNIHPSLLPEFRGPSPIHYVILEGKEKTGVTIMLVDKELDHGPVIAQEEESVFPNDTTETLSARLADHGAKLLVKTIPQLLSGSSDSVAPREQNHSVATFTKLILKEDGHIQWNESTEIIERKIRAYVPWPEAFGFVNIGGKTLRIKIIRGTISTQQSREEPGKIIEQNGLPLVATANGGIFLHKLQVEGKKPISGQDLINGYPMILGAKFE